MTLFKICHFGFCLKNTLFSTFLVSLESRVHEEDRKSNSFLSSSQNFFNDFNPNAFSHHNSMVSVEVGAGVGAGASAE